RAEKRATSPLRCFAYCRLPLFQSLDDLGKPVCNICELLLSRIHAGHAADPPHAVFIERIPFHAMLTMEVKNLICRPAQDWPISKHPLSIGPYPFALHIVRPGARLVPANALPTLDGIVLLEQGPDRLLGDRHYFQLLCTKPAFAARETTFPDAEIQERISGWL